jgi:hypothetical protein
MTAPRPTSQPAPVSERPRLRLVVVPTPQPPLEDERQPVRLVLPGIVPPRPMHRPGPRPRFGPEVARLDDFGPAWSPREALPDARDAGQRLITLTLEAMAGRRPFAQLQPMTSAGVFAALSAGRRPRWCTDGTAPLIVGPVHVCEPVDGVAEVSAVARRGGRAHAVAARLEGLDGRWRCTALQIG